MSAFAWLHGNAGFLAAALKGCCGRVAQAQESPCWAPVVLVAPAGPQGAPGCWSPLLPLCDFSELSQTAPHGVLHKGLSSPHYGNPASLEGAFLPQPLGL